MHSTASRLIEIFSRAQARASSAERERYLTEACEGQPELRKQVKALLSASERAGDFLEKTTQLQPSETVAEAPGAVIGHYKLLQQIGEGGCGVVYMAEQTEPIRRRVALKVIKLGMDTKQVVARFEAERQALALMDHPNIARVLDAGATETGRPFFVMELVKGIRITDYCDEHNLTTKARLDLFIQVCHAIQHAHQKGIIHRDIKPSNILVTLHDGVPVPKVIDFGIAKATQQPLTDKTMFTAFQQFIGTPAYMSPEQAELSGLDIDTRSDIYALGVLLYELLTGGVPFEPKGLLAAGFDEMRRVIREEEAPKPSTRLSTLAAADLTAVAKRRQTEPPRLVSLIRGDLDWIVMKCLEKDRARRYETANGLAEDVERHLENEPVTAAAPSARYRLLKFVRRHRAGIVTATALVLLLAAGVVVSAWQTARATKAELEATMVTTMLDVMMESLGPAVASGRDTTLLREILDKTVVRVDQVFKDQPEQRDALMKGPIAGAYIVLGDYTKAEEILRAALATAQQLHGNEHVKVAGILDALGAMFLVKGEAPKAEEMFRDALAMKRRLLGNADLEVACALHALGGVLWKEENLAEAEEVLRESLALHRKRGRAGLPCMRGVLEGLAKTLAKKGETAEAEAVLREALALQRNQSGGDQAEVYSLLSSLVPMLKEQGRLTEAESLCREALDGQRRLSGPEHSRVAWWLTELGSVLEKQKTLPKAEALYREALAIRKKVFNPEHAEVANSLNDLGYVLREQEKFAEAETVYREGLALCKKQPGLNDAEVADWLRQLAYVVSMQERLADAEALYGEELALRQKLHGGEHIEVATSLRSLALALWDRDKLAEAEARFREALAMRRKLLGPEHADIARSLDDLAWCLQDQGKYGEAKALFAEVLTMREKVLPPGSEDTAWSNNNLAWLLATCPVAALRDGRIAVAHAEKAVTATNRKIPNMLGTLAAAYAETGDFTNAITVQRGAIALLEDEKVKEEFTSRLRLYESKTPYRESAPSGPR